MSNETKNGKNYVAFNLILEWFSEHEQAKEDCKQYMSKIFTKQELDEIFDDVEAEDDTNEFAFKECYER